jgi:sigma-B regulation protein RsbU (phosphoserine phosphatase)
MKKILALLVAGLAGGITFWLTYDPHVPQTSIDLKYTRAEIVAISRQYLTDLGFDLTGLTHDIHLEFDASSTLYLEELLGMHAANRKIRSDSLLTHYWQTYFFDRSQPPSQMAHQYWAQVTPWGRVIDFGHNIPDTVKIDTLSQPEALTLATEFLRTQGFDTDDFVLENTSVNARTNRIDYTFFWTGKDSIHYMTQKVRATVVGNEIGGFRYNLEEPEWFRKAGSKIQTFVTYVVTASSLATFILVIFIIALFLKKYHDGEVGTKTGVWIFAGLFALVLAEQLLVFIPIGHNYGFGDVNRFNVRLIVFFFQMFIVQAFLSAMAAAAWSVGESSARSGWSDKLKAIDGFLHGKFFTLRASYSITCGYAFGLAILGLMFGGFAIASRQTNFGSYAISLSGIPESFFPSLSAVLLALRLALLNEIVFRFFFISWLRERTKKLWPGLIFSSLIWTLLAFNLWDFPAGFISFKVLFVCYFLFNLMMGIILIKFDLLTAVVADFVVLAFTYAIPLFNASSSFYSQHAILFGAFMLAPIVAAIIGSLKRQRFEFTQDFTPAHIRRISERERMAKELEIARSVQMSLLPKQNPLLEGYDIAGTCLPALEVGGDYYDFFDLQNGKIGIAIGDVSGKGVPAAIYMTLTKGILQSYANENESPKIVLSKLNRQMYSNIERNSFVSVFYAVLDMKNHKLKFARAGHNPAILAHQSREANTLLEPKGMAVGLESGDAFQACLEEHEIGLRAGDVITFYTDGFTEATSGRMEEFGEERLEKIISQNKFASANLIIQNVVREVKSYVGNHPQHDDMTIVVIKAL